MSRSFLACVILALVGLACQPIALAQIAFGPLTESFSATTSVVLPLAKDIPSVESVVVAPDDATIFATSIGEFGKPGDGTVVRVQGAKQTVLLDGFDDPKGLVWSGDSLYLTDIDKVWRIRFRVQKHDIPGWQRAQTKIVEDIGRTLVAGPDDFPIKPLFLNDIEADAEGNLYVSDSGDLKGGQGAVFRIGAKGNIDAIATPRSHPAIRAPNGLLMDGPDKLLVLDFHSGELSRLTLADGEWEKIADGLPGGDGIARDWDGNLYLTQWSTGDVKAMRRGSKPGTWLPAEKLPGKFENAADCCVDHRQGRLVVPDMKHGTLSTISILNNNPKVDESELKIELVRATPEEFEIEQPILVTHAGDGSGRLFVADQWGHVWIMPKDGKGEAKRFFDLTGKTTFDRREMEEGFLGMAFHPKFKANGEFFVYYSPTDRPLKAVVSRFWVSKDKPNFADPATEQELMEIDQPFWNHNGGTLAFGPDGMLYIGLGDGGSANDPYDYGQDLATPLGGVLRIDVDHKDPGKNYAVPKDNPFARRAGACPEKWCYGLRNLWRISFDRETGDLWGGDVGQDIWEEVNILKAGGNYGWRRREATHRFQATGVDANDRMTEPVWEYHHDLGKSITGGHVYRGKAVPALVGCYVYGDYVSGKMWALKYDTKANKATANHALPGNVMPIISFGEDEQGELYVVTDGGPKIAKIVPAK